MNRGIEVVSCVYWLGSPKRTKTRMAASERIMTTSSKLLTLSFRTMKAITTVIIGARLAVTAIIVSGKYLTQ